MVARAGTDPRRWKSSVPLGNIHTSIGSGLSFATRTRGVRIVGAMGATLITPVLCSALAYPTRAIARMVTVVTMNCLVFMMHLSRVGVARRRLNAFASTVCAGTVKAEREGAVGAGVSRCDDGLDNAVPRDDA